jgi:hypothetical protein
VQYADRLFVQYWGRLWPINHYRFQDHIVTLTEVKDIRWTLIDH